MPKMKSHKGLLKRVKVTARGKVKYRKPFTGHLNSGKPGQRMMRLRRKGVAKRGDIGRLEKMLGRPLKPAE